MLNESGKRAVELAVSRFGADPARVEMVVHSAGEAQARGETVDLLECFLREGILTEAQAQELRLGLERTRVAFIGRHNGNAADGNGQVTLLPEELSAIEVAADIPAELRSVGEYKILRRLGVGGTGSVFLAYHAKEARHVAVKVLDEQLALNQPALDRFYREAKSGALLQHPNIVRNIAIGRDQELGLHYLVLEYVDGPSALDLLEEFGRLSVGDAVHIVLDIARGLEHAHSRNVVHRDIKPGNILLTQSGLAKLADMGLAKRTDEQSHLTQTRQGFGTPYYMPYEQAMNAKYADARSDIYALGATFYHLLVGEVPFSGINSVEIVDKKAVGDFTPASVLNPDVPRVLDQILAKMLAKEPRSRYQTASEVIVDLERSNLSSSVPSFIDPDRAMRDPVVRQRLVSPAKTTNLDVRAGLKSPGQNDYWFVRFKDKKGQLAKAKLTHVEIVERIAAGKIGSKTEISRSMQGEFRPLTSFPEFKDSFTSKAKKPTLEPAANSETEPEAAEARFTRRAVWWLVALGAGVAMVVGTTLLLLLRQ